MGDESPAWLRCCLCRVLALLQSARGGQDENGSYLPTENSVWGQRHRVRRDTGFCEQGVAEGIAA